MRFPDLVIMSINNLRRRKLRTVLTVLGVIIGTASIVVMVSLGIGLDQMFMEQISSWGSLTTINVYSGSSYGNAVMIGGGGSSKSSDPTYITDDVIEQFGRLPHVSGVSPVLEINVVMRQGAYEAQYLSLMGVSQSFLEQIPWGKAGCRSRERWAWWWATRSSRIFIIPRQAGDTGTRASCRKWTL